MNSERLRTNKIARDLLCKFVPFYISLVIIRKVVQHDERRVLKLCHLGTSSGTIRVTILKLDLPEGLYPEYSGCHPDLNHQQDLKYHRLKLNLLK